LSSVLADGADTIVARATAAGRGGLALIRVSGEGARKIARAVCPDLEPIRGWRASLVRLLSPDGDEIDRAVVVPFNGPRSYTGEDMLEITVHGSPWIVRTTIDAVVAAGARPARPGEFTRRAVANGKLDLIQAEAINDLVAAETAWQARLARAQIGGLLSREFGALRDSIVGLLAELEGALDFSQHDIAYDRASVAGTRDRCVEQARALCDTAGVGRRIRDGIKVVILGSPNAGKSTLFNTLVGGDRAIVSPIPGTTRDVVEAEIEILGIKVVVADTAGLGSTTDPVEKEGVRRARGAAAEADAVLLLWAADGSPRPPEEAAAGPPTIRVRSKWDLAVDEREEEGWIGVSCLSGAGVDRLVGAVEDLVVSGVTDFGGEVAVSERHRRSLEKALKALEATDLELPELAAETVRDALEAAQELIGTIGAEDVLDRIFSTFCVGK